MTALCTSCNQPYDANDFCWRCEQHLSEQPPEKTLTELIAQSPPLRDYQLALRARLNAGETHLRAGIVRDPKFTQELQRRAS